MMKFNVNRVSRILLAVTRGDHQSLLQRTCPCLRVLPQETGKFVHTFSTGTETGFVRKTVGANFVVPFRRARNKKLLNKNSEYDSGSDSDSDVEESKQLPGSKVVQLQQDSLRCDLILKNGLSISRNKLELQFYEGRFRVNDRKITKKNYQVSVGDTCDIVKDFDTENPNFLNVSRVEVLKARPSGDYLLVTVRKYKNLVIDNYEKHPWEGVPTTEIELQEDESADVDSKKATKSSTTNPKELG